MDPQQAPQATSLHTIAPPAANSLPLRDTCSETTYWDNYQQPAAHLNETSLFLPRERRKKRQKDSPWRLLWLWLCPAVPTVFSRNQPNSPVQQGVVQVLTQTLQDLIVVPDGRGLVFTCSKVALQLKGTKQQPPVRNG